MRCNLKMTTDLTSLKYGTCNLEQISPGFLHYSECCKNLEKKYRSMRTASSPIFLSEVYN